MLFCITAKSIGERYKWVIHDRGWQGQRPKHVRFTPKADKQADISLSPLCANSDLTRRSKKAALFDHLVGACEQHRRHLKAERLRGLEIDHELKLGRLLNRK